MAVARIHKGLRIFLASFWLIAFAWLFYSLQASGFDPSVLETDRRVQVQVRDEAIRFTPVKDTTTAGLVFYPGALVDPEAYAPLARTVAEAGYLAVIVKVPFRIAAFDRQRDEVISRTEAVLGHTNQTAWVIGGHSRGAKMAARFAKEHPEMVEGLLLVGTSHPREHDLSHLEIDVTKVFGSNDGLASEEEVKQFAGNLPAGTHWVRVEGGNHTQFGWYGWQLGDERAGIDRETQQRITAQAIVAQLRRVQRANRPETGPPAGAQRAAGDSAR